MKQKKIDNRRAKSGNPDQGRGGILLVGQKNSSHARNKKEPFFRHSLHGSIYGHVYENRWVLFVKSMAFALVLSHFHLILSSFLQGN